MYMTNKSLFTGVWTDIHIPHKTKCFV